MTEIFHQVLLTCLVAAGACMFVRWVLPTVIRAVLGLLLDGVLWAGALLLLPEYWLSCAHRRRNCCPPRAAYEYSSAVAGMCRVAHLLLRRAMRGLAWAAWAVPMPLVAVVAGGVYVADLTR